MGGGVRHWLKRKSTRKTVKREVTLGHLESCVVRLLGRFIRIAFPQDVASRSGFTTGSEGKSPQI